MLRLPSAASRLAFRLSVGGLSLALCPALHAQSTAFNGTIDSDWHNVDNWFPAPPDASFAVAISDAIATLSSGTATAGSLYLGDGALLTVSNSATLELINSFTSVDVDYGAQLTATGLGSTILMPGELYIYTGSVTVTAGASLTSGSGAFATFYEDNIASITVSNGGTWTTGSLQLGGDAAGTATLTVDNGAVEVTGSARILRSASILVQNGGTLQTANNGEFDAFSTIDFGATVTVSGDGSTWTSPSFANIGDQDEGTLIVENGGSVTFGNLSTGGWSSGTGNVLVTGAGSLLTTTGIYYPDYDFTAEDTLGFYGASHVTVSAGGRYDAYSIGFGYDNHGQDSTFTITGAGSQLNVTNHLTIGNFGDGTFLVSDGATVTTGSASVAYGSSAEAPAGVVGIATVTGTGSSWTTGSLNVGGYWGDDDYNLATLTVANGGRLTVVGGSGIVELERKGTINIGNGGLSGTFNAGGIEFVGGVADDSTVHFNHTDNLTFSVPITSSYAWTGMGQVIKSGSGTLTLTGANTYDGPTWIQAGVVSIGAIADFLSESPLASPLGAPTNAARGRIKLGAETSTGTLRYTGAAASTNRGLELAGTTGGGTLDASGTAEFTLSGTVISNTAGNKTLTLTGTNTGANTLGGIISNSTGSIAIAKTGTGLWTLTGANSFSRGVTVSAGTLRATHASSLGNGSLTLNGGTLQPANNSATTFTGTNTTVTGDATLAPSRTTNGNAVSHTLGTLSIGNQTLTIAHGTNFNSNQTGSLVFGATTLTGNPTFALNNTNGSNRGQLTLGAISDGGDNFGFTKTGNGTLILAANNSFTGTATISSGTLQIGNGAGTGNLLGNIVNNGTLAINRTGDLSLDGAISGTGALTKSGSGTLTLSASNSYAGATTISAGTVIVTANNALGTAAGATSVASGATLALSGGFNYSTAETLNLNTSTSGSLSNLSGANTFAGSISVGGLSRIIVASGSQLTLSGAITGSSQISLSGGGTLTLSNSSNSLSGNLAFGSNTTVIAAADHVLGHTFSGSVNVNSTGTLAFQGGINYTSGKNVTLVGNGASGRNGALDNLSGHNTFAGTLTIADPNTRIGAAADTRLTLTGSIGSMINGWGLTIAGPGTIELTGANSYSGATSVTGGTLLVNNLTSTSATGDSVVTVAAGATLGGSGFISGATTINGTLAPGNSAGVLTFASNLTLGPDSFTLIQLGGLLRGSEHDAVDVGGTLTFGGTLTVSLADDFNPMSGATFDIFDWTTGTIGSFSALVLPTLTGLTWNTDALYTTGTLSLNASAIPEPSTYAALFGACALGVVLWRRRRR